MAQGKPYQLVHGVGKALSIEGLSFFVDYIEWIMDKGRLPI
jgi:hypothetical protein